MRSNLEGFFSLETNDFSFSRSIARVNQRARTKLAEIVSKVCVNRYSSVSTQRACVCGTANAIKSFDFKVLKLSTLSKEPNDARSMCFWYQKSLRRIIDMHVSTTAHRTKLS